MIVANLVHLAEQAAMSPALRKTVDFLRRAEGQTLPPDGRIEIDGENAYALVQSYETLLGDDWVVEGHRRYLDLHYMVTGEEVIGWAASDRVEVTTPYDAVKDTWLGRVPTSEVTRVRLAAGQAVLLYPGDAHAPRQATSCPVQVRKIVAKIAIPGE
jgi:YhcH/YjgK/YiaL family protein